MFENLRWCEYRKSIVGKSLCNRCPMRSICYPEASIAFNGSSTDPVFFEIDP